MKIKIDTHGRLEVARAGKLEAQYCMMNNRESRCGHQCPLFEEPHIVGVPSKDVIGINLCRTTLTCKVEEFEDERK